MDGKRFRETSDFISSYMTSLLGAGVHTSRVIRNSKRLGEALGVSVNISTFQKAAIITVSREGEDPAFVSTKVVEIPAYPVSFEWNADLSALSWAAYDRKYSLEQAENEFRRIISKPRMNPLFVMLMTGLANASFCRLFGGNVWAMLIVFTSTLLGFYTRQHLTLKNVNHYVIFIVSSFVASLCASTSLSLGIESAEIALATSVLYLVPGVPLINGVLDVADGHVLIGFSRLVNAFLLIVCIATGLSMTLMLVKNSLL